MKIIKEQIEEMKKLNKKLNIKEVSKKMNLPYSTVLYHLSRKFRLGSIERNKVYQKNHPPKRGDSYREYQRIYQNKRYWRLKGKEK